MKKTKSDIPAFTPYQKLLIALVAFMQFTIILDFMIISPLGDILMKTLNMTTSQFGTVVSAYAFSAGISGILAAGFADRFDRKKMLLFFYSGFIIGTFCCAFAPDYLMLLLARIVTGFFGGVMGSISLAIVTDIFLPNQRGRVMGFVQMAFAVSQIAGIPLGIYFATHWGWHSAFLMVVALSVATGLVIVFKMKPVDKHLGLPSQKSPLLHLWHTVRKRDYRIGFGTIAFLSVGGFMLQPFGSAYLINNLKITEDQLPIVFLCTGLAVLVIMPIVGKLSDKIDKIKLFIIGTGITIVMCLVYTNLPVTPLWGIIGVNMVLFIGIMSRIVPAQAINTAIPDPADRGAYMSMTSSMQQIAGGIGAVFAGFIVYQPNKFSPLQNYPVLGIVVSIVTLVTAFLMVRLNRIAMKKDVRIEPETVPSETF